MNLQLLTTRMYELNKILNRLNNTTTALLQYRKLCKYKNCIVVTVNDNGIFKTTSNNNNNKRLLSNGPSSSSSSSKLPPLMDFPKITWPSFIKSIKNFILGTFIIKPYLDNDFQISDFVAGSEKAVQVVSKKIAEGDVKSLDGLVTNDIIPTLQRAIALMSLSQREQIAVNVADIYFSFPYQIGVILNEDQKRFVEITMVFHVLRDLGLMRERGEEPPMNMGMMPEYQNRISICNYRFIREFTKGVENGDWTINLLNHFKPIDDMQN